MRRDLHDGAATAAAPGLGATGGAERAPARVCLGVITGARGLKGEVWVKTFTADPAAVAAYGPLQDDAGARSLRLSVAAAHSDRVVARVEGIGDRTAAEALKGTRLFVGRGQLPEPQDEDEYYHADLIGLPVRLDDPGANHRLLGHVRAVEDHGGGAVLEIVDNDGGTYLVPFTKAAVPLVDIGARRLTVAPLPGLLEPAVAAAGGG
jgi:16S rRNA processing protein RimM